MQESKSCALPLGDSPKVAIATGWIKGFEPLASRATIWRANQLRYTHHSNYLQKELLSHMHEIHYSIANVPEGIRTPDPRLRRPLLYPAELRTHTCQCLCISKAGDGNRTHVSSLEGWCSTIELHPHIRSVIGPCILIKTLQLLRYQVGVTGFEPATSWSQTRRSSQAEPHPEGFLATTFVTQVR